MNSRERVLAALNHQTPDRCPIDLGSNGQTGMNVTTVNRLRGALGLDQHRLKVIEPLQMLGEIEPDLLKAVHSDFVGLWNRGNMMGFMQDNWKPFDMDDGTPTWMGGGFEYERNAAGDVRAFVCGDRNAPVGYCMPKGGTFFDNIDHFDEPYDMDIDEAAMTPREDFRDDFQVATDEDARYWEEESKKLYEGTDYAIVGVLGGAGFGDVAWVPGPTVKHPRGIRKVQDWLLAQAMYPDYVDEVFDYIANVFLKYDKEYFCPETVYEGQMNYIENYPDDIPYADMTGIQDYEAKERLLSIWKY